MSKGTHNRRQFIRRAAAAGAAAAVTPYWFSSARSWGAEAQSNRHLIGCIGTGDRWRGAIGPQVMNYGDVVAVCDVDRNNMEQAREQVGGKAEMHEDYRKILDRNDIDVVTIVTPDHWHAKIAIEAMQAGKDVYVEKPMTLTIDEGKKICEVQKKTGRVVQVGTQQRSEFNGEDPKNKTRFEHLFLQAVALAHMGKLGKLNRVRIVLRANPTCPSLPKVDVPSGLNWEKWLGQAPLVDYIEAPSAREFPKYPYSRCHYEFRWWYEYSGGKMTDWGAHHMDIAQFALGLDNTGPVSVEGTGEHPVPFKDGHPTVDNQYNCARKFEVKCAFANGAEITVKSGSEDSIWIEGDEAEIKVNRGSLRDIRGEVVAQLAKTPIPDDVILKLCKGKKPGNHMGNFFECIADRSEPISDVHTHHRAMSTCHLANISIRLNRPLKYDPDKQEIVGDDEANKWLAREQRKGYEVKV